MPPLWHNQIQITLHFINWWWKTKPENFRHQETVSMTCFIINLIPTLCAYRSFEIFSMYLWNITDRYTNLLLIAFINGVDTQYIKYSFIHDVGNKCIHQMIYRISQLLIHTYIIHDLSTLSNCSQRQGRAPFYCRF